MTTYVTLGRTEWNQQVSELQG